MTELKEVYEVTLEIKILRKPYSLKDLEQLIAIFNEVHDQSMIIEITSECKKLPEKNTQTKKINGEN